MTATTTTAGRDAVSASRPVSPGVVNALGTVPFFAYTAIFLVLPTVLVVIGAFQSRGGGFTLNGFTQVLSPRTVNIFGTSLWISLLTALVGAIAGGVIAYALTLSPEGSLGRRVFTALMSVTAQFGGVMLAFAFLATFGFNGLITMLIKSSLGINGLDMSWLYSMTGLAVVYTYFQIPLMLIVFLPSLDGLRQEWYDASASLGGGAWAFWRHVGGPILAPSFLGALLLLFTNAFSAYATVQALISQGCVLITQQIACQMQSEVVLGQANVGKALALGMIVIVSAVMAIYALIQRRASRWVK